MKQDVMSTEFMLEKLHIAEGVSGLRVIADQVDACDACPLHKDPGKSVPGVGNTEADLVFIGEAPGAEESKQGLPFVGRAGKLLTNMIISMGLTRDDVWIGNICKHRPLNNRKPSPAEMITCIPFLYRQINIIKPKVVVALGNTALEGLTGYGSITKRIGKWEEIEIDGLKIKLMPCYHPSYLLRASHKKDEAWYALQKVLPVLDGD